MPWDHLECDDLSGAMLDQLEDSAAYTRTHYDFSLSDEELRIKAEVDGQSPETIDRILRMKRKMAPSAG